MSTAPTQPGLRLEVIPHFTDVTPRAQELAELYLQEMGDLANYDPDLVAKEIDDMRGSAIVTLIDEENERVVAMGGLVQPLGSSEGIVTNVATSSEHRREGLGRTIVNEIARIAAYEGLTQLSASPTPMSEPFYTELGFDQPKSGDGLRIKKL